VRPDRRDGRGRWLSGAGGDGGFQGFGVDAEGLWVDLDEDGFEPEQGYDFGGGDIGKGGGNDFVAGLQVEGHHGYLQGIGAVGAGDDMPGPGVGGEGGGELVTAGPLINATLSSTSEMAESTSLFIFVYCCFRSTIWMGRIICSYLVYNPPPAD
jgi:hypothetical protein